jgi:hypothetical protein
MTDFSERTTLSDELPRLQERLTDLRIAFEVAPTKTDASGKGEQRCIYAKRFSFDDDPEVVAARLREILFAYFAHRERQFRGIVSARSGAS